MMNEAECSLNGTLGSGVVLSMDEITISKLRSLLLLHHEGVIGAAQLERAQDQALRDASDRARAADGLKQLPEEHVAGTKTSSSHEKDKVVAGAEGAAPKTIGSGSKLQVVTGSGGDKAERSATWWCSSRTWWAARR